MPEIPIPLRLAGRPTRSGLVVPYISLEIDGHVEFGQTRGFRVAQCVVNRLCQICGQRLGQKFVFLVTERMLEQRFSREPALHPDCAAYSIKACPMVTGRMPTYARTQRDHTGEPCNEPGCSCAGWITADNGLEGTPAVPWFSAWFTGYAIGIKDPKRRADEVGNVSGCVFNQEPLTVRPIAAAAAEAV